MAQKGRHGVASPAVTSPPRSHSRHTVALGRSTGWTGRGIPAGARARACARPPPRGTSSFLARLSDVRPTKEETSSGSIFRVRRCNKKQSSQRGVDRRWHGLPRLVRRLRHVDDRLSRPYIAQRPILYLFRAFGLSSRRHSIGICISKFARRRALFA